MHEDGLKNNSIFLVPVGNSGYLTWVRQAAARIVCYPFLYSCVSPNNGMVGIFNMHADVDVCDSTQGLYRHCKSQHWELTGRKIPCHTRGLVLHQHCAWRFSSSCSTSVPLILTSSIFGGSFHIEIEASC